MTDGTSRVRVEADLADLVPTFLRRRHSEVDTLLGHLEADRMEAIRAAGHALKGTAGAYGFEELAAIGAALEREASAGDTAALAATVARMRAHLDRVEVIYE